MSDFNNMTEADHQTTKALWHEAKGTVRLQAIRIRELEAKVSVYECNAFYQSGYHAATAVSEARIRALERAMRKCIDDCADMSGALPIQTHALRWMTWLENALQATEAETTGDAK